MSWTGWGTHFEDNARRPLLVISCALPEIAPALREPLLAKLELGDRGEGRIAHQIDHEHALEIDDEYRAALRLMIREEGRVRWKPWVLAIAETVSSACDRELSAALPAGAARRALGEIAEDEANHLAFHGALFARRRSSQLDRAAWWLCGAGLVAFIVGTYGTEMARLGVPRRTLARRMVTQLDTRTFGVAA